MLSPGEREQVTELVKELIRQRSDSGEEEGVAYVLGMAMRAAGFDEVRLDRLGNLIGLAHGKRPGPTILFDGHMDTASVLDAREWSYDPLSAKVADGKMYGRGTVDMKGALGAMVCAASQFIAETKGDFAGTLAIAGTVYGEQLEGVAARGVSASVRPDVVVVGEASGLDIKVGQCGRAQIVVETFGTSCHTAFPERGANAVYAMVKAIEAIGRIRPPEHSLLGKGTLELTDIISSPYPGRSVVPERCQATYDRRLHVGETPEGVIVPIEKCLESVMARYREVRACTYMLHDKKPCYTGASLEADCFFPGWMHSSKEPCIVAVKEELVRLGYRPKVTTYDLCTDGSHYAGEANIPTFGLGPGEESVAHTVDEHVELGQLWGACECYRGIMRALLVKDVDLFESVQTIGAGISQTY